MEMKEIEKSWVVSVWCLSLALFIVNIIVIVIVIFIAIANSTVIVLIMVMVIVLVKVMVKVMFCFWKVFLGWVGWWGWLYFCKWWMRYKIILWHSIKPTQTFVFISRTISSGILLNILEIQKPRGLSSTAYLHHSSSRLVYILIR